MWRQLGLVNPAALAAIAGLSACGSSSRYRDALGDYEQAAPKAEPVDDGRELFAGQNTLTAGAVVDATLERNPSIEAARAGWRAALARYPQATSFDDPTLSYTLAPLSIASDVVDFGHSIELSQPLPWPGKRRLRGEVALAEAEAARQDYEAVRLRLAAMAASFYYDLWAVERAVAIYREFERELEAHRKTLVAHLAAGHAWQEEALKVEVDLGETVQARIDLEGEREIIAAQLNELLHRRPDLPLPPLPESLEPPGDLDRSAGQLQDLALELRPELDAAAARREVESARIAVARRELYPDFRVMGQYNSMWPELEHELMVGVGINLPIWRGRRHAAVDEATARRDRATAEISATRARIRAEVQRAVEAHEAAVAVLAKVREDIVPAARSRVKAIRVGLESGRTSFIEVLRADHDLLAANLRLERATAAVWRRRVALEQAIGRLGRAEGGAR